MAKQTLGSVFVGLGVTLAASLTVVMGCGGDSGATRLGSTGGTTTTTGTGGAGGSTAAGTGGASTTSVANCSPGVDPSSSLWTTFTSSGTTPDWNMVSGRWGVSPGLTGSIFAYSGMKAGTSMFKASVDTTAGVLDIGAMATTGVTAGTVAVGDYAGGGISLAPPQCVNTSTYTGVTFTLGGSTGGCDLYFQIQTDEAQPTKYGGGCTTSSCPSFPQIKLVSGSAPLPTGPTTVHFTDLTGGAPDGGPAIAMQIIGLQWQLQSSTPVADASQTGCTNVEFTIDDVSFVSN